jgi:hypothetical protein
MTIASYTYILITHMWLRDAWLDFFLLWNPTSTRCNTTRENKTSSLNFCFYSKKTETNFCCVSKTKIQEVEIIPIFFFFFSNQKSWNEGIKIKIKRDHHKIVLLRRPGSAHLQVSLVAYKYRKERNRPTGHDDMRLRDWQHIKAI